MANIPEISFIVPTFARPDLTYDCVKSVIANVRNVDYEIIIVENPSGSMCDEKILKSLYSQIKYIRHKENLGPFRNWLRGLNAASGHCALLLFSDDLLLELDGTNLCILRSGGEVYLANVDIIDENANLLSENIYRSAQNKTTKQIFTGVLYGKSGFPVSPCCLLANRNKLIDALEDYTRWNFFGFDNGAGPDVWIFLKIFADRNTVMESLAFKVAFRAHDGSFSTSEESNLKVSLNYMLARLSFLTFDNRHLEKARVLLYLFFKFGYTQPRFVLMSPIDFFFYYTKHAKKFPFLYPVSAMAAFLRYAKIIILKIFGGLC
jgi:glycosyltransferase involved in cell wall biosynthesis